MLSITEIQYLRGLIFVDKIANNYETEGMAARIDQNTSMNDFTDNIIGKLDELEDEFDFEKGGEVNES